MTEHENILNHIFKCRCGVDCQEGKIEGQEAQLCDACRTIYFFRGGKWQMWFRVSCEEAWDRITTGVGR